MPPRPFGNDALWRCLCPRFPSNPSILIAARTGASVQQRLAPRKHLVTLRPGHQSRAYNTSNDPFQSSDAFSFQRVAVTGHHAHRKPSREPSRSPRGKPLLAQVPTYNLYELVRAEGESGHFEDVMNICRVLVQDRGELPNKVMYTAILHSFVSSSNGTPGKVRKVLEEMGFFGDIKTSLSGQPKIELDARGCECVLEVLAVHPDYLLRTEILEYMKSRWFPLSARGQNFVVAGTLRERHFEHALEMLEDMVKNEVRVENWLFDKAIWILLEFGEIEEAFHVLSLKEGVQSKAGTGTVQLSVALWGALLDAAGQRQLHEAARMVWVTQVQPGYLRPVTGTCLSVLALAARNGDVELATDVFRVLTERETTFTTHHYELLVATYLNADDLSAALSVILIMADARLKVDAGTCNPLYRYLSTETSEEGSRPMHAFSLLQEFEAAGRKVPTAPVNACIQASIARDRFEEAIEMYKALHTVSHAGPNTQTFNELFRGCHLTARKDLAMFLTNEMMELGLKPDVITYDRLILVCVTSGDLEDALQYYKEMRTVDARGSGKGPMQPRPGTWERLIHECVVQGDERAVALVEDYKAGVDEPRRHVVKAVVDRFEYGMLPIGVEGAQTQSGHVGNEVVNATSTESAMTKDMNGTESASEKATEVESTGSKPGN
ncbi:uncharacterized protein K460DRAFT_361339 [Cucurbitaria berberidis CBS 394.84]|uniref:Pentatricopeptide repeat-containing protein-mitochondrial domain-containing protein n=1 Tax=Cucurbitaria berberidis CBS 394.84 TaxID=1168544 RepID=A0A9P4LD94_9PLEO|nr:uncharacterized protein K460DRAFT_361339 [Cucurbitaria berberidis CBS 394.84]KAF1850568.1 hypothetical protein K460DRAFT_361339 [Cucurbitaria berberidis CBS 394.84]